MNEHELNEILNHLLAGGEHECVEFKAANDNYPTSDLGKYFSALSNEANLRGLTAAWLIFGVENQTRTIIGTNYRRERDRLQGLKHQIAQGTDPATSFREIHELNPPSGRVVLFEIPAAPRGMPIAWQTHFYARDGASLTGLSIAHQDYTRGERVLVIERVGELEFQNAGEFYDGSPEEYIRGNRSPRRYRNRFLAEAMVTLRMIDTMGFGIHEVMWKGQASRYLPLPDYDLTEPGHVKLRIPGRFIDENYSRVLLANADLPWPDVLALDKIQKGLAPEDELTQDLRRRGLVEGRKPKLHVAADVAAATETEAEYLHHRAFDDAYYCDLLIEYLKRFGTAKRTKFNRLLEDKLSDLLTARQKQKKIDNLLQRLRRERRVCVKGYGQAGVWSLPAD